MISVVRIGNGNELFSSSKIGKSRGAAAPREGRGAWKGPASMLSAQLTTPFRQSFDVVRDALREFDGGDDTPAHRAHCRPERVEGNGEGCECGCVPSCMSSAAGEPRCTA